MSTDWYLILCSHKCLESVCSVSVTKNLILLQSQCKCSKGRNQVKILIFTYWNNSAFFSEMLLLFIRMFPADTQDWITTSPCLYFTHGEKWTVKVLHYLRITGLTWRLNHMCTKTCQSPYIQAQICMWLFTHQSFFFFLYATPYSVQTHIYTKLGFFHNQ